MHFRVKREPWRRWSCSNGWFARCESPGIETQKSAIDNLKDRQTSKRSNHTINILRKRNEVLILPRQVCQCVVCRVRLRLQCHMPSKPIKLPHQIRVHFERFGRRQICRIVGSPEASCASESGKPRGGRDACPQECHDTLASFEVRREGLEIGCWNGRRSHGGH